MRAAFAEIVPIGRLPRSLDVFDYRIPAPLAERLAPGQLVRIPFRQRAVVGVIIRIKSSSSVSEGRLRDVSAVLDDDWSFSTTQLHLARIIADRYGASIATAVNLFAPPIIRRQKTSASSSTSRTPLRKTLRSTTLIIPQTFTGRIDVIRELLNRVVRDRQPTLVLVPQTITLEAISELVPATARTIIGTERSQGDRLQHWLAVRRRQTLIVIGSPRAVFLPFQDLRNLIILDEDDDAFKQRDRTPRTDSRWIAKALADALEASVTIVSVFPRLETWDEARHREWQIIEYGHAAPPKTTVIDLREEFRAGNTHPLPDRLEPSIRSAIRRQQHVFLFVHRRGFARSISCQDCGHLVRCSNCEVPLSSSGSERLVALHCRRCGLRSELPPFCTHCNGTNFKLHGMGTERLESDIKKRFPGARVVRIEKDNRLSFSDATPTTDHTPGEAHRSNSSTRQTDVTIGTAHAFPSIPWKRTSLVAVWPDPNLLLDFRSGERTMRLLTGISKRLPAGAILSIQTSSPDHPAIRAFVDGKHAAWYEQELKDRMKFHYPPSTSLIALSLERPKVRDAEKERDGLETTLQQNRNQFPGFTIHRFSPRPRRRGHSAVGLLLRFPPTTPHADYSLLLKLVPTSWTIDPDPTELT